MTLLFTILVTFFAGMGAGLGTGFAGMSAAAVISPMLITFLDVDPYMAVGIALSSDLLASAVSAYVSHRSRVALCHRRRSRLDNLSSVRGVHVPLGENRIRIRQ